MEEIYVCHDQLQQVLDLQGHYGPGKWAFSCNRLGMVSPTVGAGDGNVSKDSNLQGRLPLLDQIVQVVLENCSDGGRFKVENNLLYLAAHLSEGDYEPIAEFIID